MSMADTEMFKYTFTVTVINLTNIILPSDISIYNHVNSGACNYNFNFCINEIKCIFVYKFVYY